MKNQRLYFLSLCLIGLLVLPVNGTTFGNMAGTVIEQWIMAGTLGIVIPLSAHFAGRSWKIGRRWIAITTTVMIVGLFISMGQAREYVMFTSFGEEEVPIQKWVTVIISILLYGVATVLSLARHDISPNMEEVV